MAVERLSTEELIEEIRSVERQLGALEEVIAGHSLRLSRTLKLIAGSGATMAGLVLAVPTGGLTAFLAGFGVVLCADAFREDAQMDNERRKASAEHRRLQRALVELDLELRKRGR